MQCPHHGAKNLTRAGLSLPMCSSKFADVSERTLALADASAKRPSERRRIFETIGRKRGRGADESGRVVTVENTRGPFFIVHTHSFLGGTARRKDAAPLWWRFTCGISCACGPAARRFASLSLELGASLALAVASSAASDGCALAACCPSCVERICRHARRGGGWCVRLQGALPCVVLVLCRERAAGAELRERCGGGSVGSRAAGESTGGRSRQWHGDGGFSWSRRFCFGCRLGSSLVRGVQAFRR